MKLYIAKILLLGFLGVFNNSIDITGNFLDNSIEEQYINKHLPSKAEKILFKKKNYFTEQLDGKGNKEIIVPFKEKGIDKAIFLLVINYDDTSSTAYKVKGEGSNIERLEFHDINGDGKKDIVLGTRTGMDIHELTVYSHGKNKMHKEFSYSYSKLDILEDSKDSSVVMAFWKRGEQNCFKIELVRWNGKELIEAKDLNRKYFAKVVEYYKNLCSLQRDNAWAWYYLADAQIKAGFKEDAAVSIANGVALNKESPSKQQFEQLKSSIK
ncbi:MAG: hypothetical protein GX895_05490 [Clostridiales bacterium]|uniref:tetratricopeptide repeat protein n=1 Tax=Clostridium sp. N3C TaxID=1776758 RepID=UPI00092DF981|nr:hypothetical protein [Clostridium sp. N3C]NLZ48234.1 hypothetical protein [Clostridiales bacterium]SCN22252.1 hypothetical protein N3C_0666 [Clostridium sp. N3C]